MLRDTLISIAFFFGPLLLLLLIKVLIDWRDRRVEEKRRLFLRLEFIEKKLSDIGADLKRVEDLIKALQSQGGRDVL